MKIVGYQTWADLNVEAVEPKVSFAMYDTDTQATRLHTMDLFGWRHIQPDNADPTADHLDWRGNPSQSDEVNSPIMPVKNQQPAEFEKKDDPQNIYAPLLLDRKVARFKPNKIVSYVEKRSFPDANLNPLHAGQPILQFELDFQRKTVIGDISSKLLSLEQIMQCFKGEPDHTLCQAYPPAVEGNVNVFPTNSYESFALGLCFVAEHLNSARSKPLIDRINDRLNNSLRADCPVVPSSDY